MTKRVSEVKRKKMIEDPIKKVIPAMAIPTIIAQMITIIYNLVDTFFVSSLGTSATAAVGVNHSLEQIINLTAQLIGSGACSYVARLLGAGDKKKADEVFNTGLLTGISLGALISVIGLSTLEGLVNLLGATEDCKMYSMQYGQYVLMAAPFMISSMIFNMCLRSEGSATYALIGIGFGGVLNCFLDPLFIFKLNLGVAGASMATAISKVVSFCILLAPYIRKRTQVTMSIKNIHYTVADSVEVIKIGSTSFFRSALQVVANTTMNRIAGGFSTSALAAISVANRLMQFPFGIVLGFGQGYQPVVGFNWGAKRFDRVKEAFTFSSMVSIAGGAILSTGIFIFAKPLINIFTTADGEMLEIGIFCVRAQCFVLPVHAWVSIINMFYAGIGKATNAILLSTSRSGYCYIPMLLLLPKLFGTNGLASCQAAADALSFFVALPMGIAAVKFINKKIKGEFNPVNQNSA